MSVSDKDSRKKSSASVDSSRHPSIFSTTHKDSKRESNETQDPRRLQSRYPSQDPRQSDGSFEDASSYKRHCSPNTPSEIERTASWQKSPRPIDTGWSWVICFASFSCLYFGGLSMSIMSVLMLDIARDFQTTVFIVSLAPMSFTLSLAIMSVLAANVFVPQWGERVVVCSAGLGVSLSLMIQSVVPNIGLFIAVHGLAGACIGAMVVTSISIVSAYFKKRRSIATSITNCGLSLALITFPEIIRRTYTHYGLHGTFLIFGAVQLHTVAGGLLLRPTSTYGPPVQSTDEKEGNLRGHRRAASIFGEYSAIDIFRNQADINAKPRSRSGSVWSRTASIFREYSSPTINVPSQEETRKSRERLKSANLELSMLSSDERSNRRNTIHFEKRESNVTSSSNESKPTNTESLKSDSIWSRAGSVWSSAAYMFSNPSPRMSESSQEEAQNREKLKSANQELSILISDELSTRRYNIDLEKSESSVMISSKASTLEPAITVHIEHSIDAEEEEDEKDRRVTGLHIYTGIFRSWYVRLWLISSFLVAPNPCLFTYLPTIAVDKGASHNEGAYIIVITCSVDLISRFIVGFISDKEFVQPSYIVAIAQLSMGVICYAGIFVDGFNSLVVWASAMGMFIGVSLSLRPMVIIQLVGVENMPKLFSISFFVAVVSAASLMAGLAALHDLTGSYNPVLIYMGSSLLVAGFLIGLIPFIRRWEERKRHLGCLKEAYTLT